jgi:hypothetical protein
MRERRQRSIYEAVYPLPAFLRALSDEADYRIRRGAAPSFLQKINPNEFLRKRSTVPELSGTFLLEKLGATAMKRED